MEDRSWFDLEACRYLDDMGNPSLKKIVDRIIIEAFEDHDRRDELMSVYSDVYKEKHGIRPRWIMTRMMDMSTEQIEMALDELMDEPESVDYDDDFQSQGSDEPLVLEPGGMSPGEPEIDLDDPFDALPKQAGMRQRHRPKTRLHGPNTAKR